MQNTGNSHTLLTLYSMHDIRKMHTYLEGAKIILAEDGHKVVLRVRTEYWPDKSSAAKGAMGVSTATRVFANPKEFEDYVKEHEDAINLAGMQISWDWRAGQAR